MDQEAIDQIAHLRIDIEVNKMVLQQFVGFAAANMLEPQKALAEMRQKVQERVDRLPSNEVTNLLQSRLVQFFAPIEKSLVQMADGPREQRPN